MGVGDWGVPSRTPLYVALQLYAWREGSLSTAVPNLMAYLDGEHPQTAAGVLVLLNG